MELLIHLIEIENTGTAQHIADRIGVSRRTIFEYISTLNDAGRKVEFNRHKKTYFFSENS